MRAWFLASVLCFAAQATAAEPTLFVHEGKLAWVYDQGAAIAQARALHRPIMVDFYADWCSSCMELDHKTYTDPRVRDAVAARFVPLKVNCTDDTPEVRTIEQQYGIEALPTVLFLDSDGHPLKVDRINEFVAPDAFLAQLAKVK